MLHKYICMTNTTDECWEGYQDDTEMNASLVSSANACYWSNDDEHGLFLLEDVDEKAEITVDYGQYVMPVEKQLVTRKRCMSADLLRLLLVVSSQISPLLAQKISEC